MCIHIRSSYTCLTYAKAKFQLHASMHTLGELIMSRYVRESITTDCRTFQARTYVGLCRLRTKQFCMQVTKHPAISCYWFSSPDFDSVAMSLYNIITHTLFVHSIVTTTWTACRLIASYCYLFTPHLRWASLNHMSYLLRDCLQQKHTEARKH